MSFVCIKCIFRINRPPPVTKYLKTITILYICDQKIDHIYTKWTQMCTIPAMNKNRTTCNTNRMVFSDLVTKTEDI